MGINASVCRTNVSLEKNYFLTGETIRVHIAVDNSECKKEVKTIKLKLERRIEMSGRRVDGYDTVVYTAPKLDYCLGLKV
jgi:Arrestin (or S-antigen), C-terminal domain